MLVPGLFFTVFSHAKYLPSPIVCGLGTSPSGKIGDGVALNKHQVLFKIWVYGRWAEKALKVAGQF